MATNYQRGRDLEYELKRILTENGWTTMRSAGSHGMFDVVAIREGKKNRDTLWLLMAQCKRTKLTSEV